MSGPTGEQRADPAAPALDGPLAAAWLRAADAALDARRAEVDRLNVFPVPDGDTGTNLCLTLRAAVEALPADGASLDEVLAAAAGAAVLGARGNSGVLLSQLLDGLARSLPGATAEAAALATAMAAADALAWDAVDVPVAGTILSVSRAAADAARGAPDLAGLVTAAAAAAREALRRTPDELAALGGTLDAGGAGLVVVVDALAAVVTGRPAPPLGLGRPAAASTCATAPDRDRLEVMCRLDDPAGAASDLRAALGSLGSSVAVAASTPGPTTRWRVHVHTDDPAAALAAAGRHARPADVRVVVLVPDPSAVPVLVVTADPALAAHAASAGLAVAPEVPGPDGVLLVDEALGGELDVVRLVVAVAAAATAPQDPAPAVAAALGRVRVLDAATPDAVVAHAADAELLTVVSGADAPPGLADDVLAAVTAARPDAEVVVVATDRPGLRLAVGAE